MRRLVLVLAAILFLNVAKAQDTSAVEIMGYTTPNYEQIKKDCADKHSARYYPKLIKRFAAVDTNLDVADMQTLYYGQVFLDGYSAYRHYNEFDEIRAIMHKEEAPTVVDTRKIVNLADAVITRAPVEPMAYFYKYVGQNMACEYFGGDTVEMQQTQLQFQMLFYTIASTGNGIAPELAMHVVSVAHEHMMLNMYGFRPTQQALMSIDGHSYDMFVVDTNEYGVDTLYFNIDRIVGSWNTLFSQKEESKPTTTIDLELGVKFVLQLDKPKRKNSKFVLVSQEYLSDTLICDRDSLYREPVPENQIVGYFCPMRLYEGSENVNNCLVFISNCDKDQLYYDVFIAAGDHKEYFQSSNSGMPRGVMMNEMWLTDVQGLRISNIRTKE